jgi:hypothetical protein
MKVDATLAFRVYKKGTIDEADGLPKLASVCFAIMDGPLAGLAINGIEIKGHPERGMQAVLPANIECYVKEPGAAEYVCNRIVDAFAASYRAAVTPPKEKDFADFPDPTQKWLN